MKRNFLITVFGLFVNFLVVLGANAVCNIEHFRFGSTIKDIEQQTKNMRINTLPTSEIYNSVEDKYSLSFAGEDICKDDDVFIGAPVEMIFLYGKLVELRLIKFLENGDDPVLITWAEKAYGQKTNKPRSYDFKEPSMYLLLSNFNATVSYSITSVGYGIEEVVVIQSRRYRDLFKKYSKKEDGV
jgi:hypothetical protein